MEAEDSTDEEDAEKAAKEAMDEATALIAAVNKMHDASVIEHTQAG